MVFFWQRSARNRQATPAHPRKSSFPWPQSLIVLRLVAQFDPHFSSLGDRVPATFMGREHRGNRAGTGQEQGGNRAGTGQEQGGNRAGTGQEQGSWNRAGTGRNRREQGRNRAGTGREQGWKVAISIVFSNGFEVLGGQSHLCKSPKLQFILYFPLDLRCSEVPKSSPQKLVITNKTSFQCACASSYELPGHAPNMPQYILPPGGTPPHILGNNFE